MTRVDKPALLKRAFELGCNYSGQILSYTKMQGQLQDAGNTTTLAHYIDLLSHAGLLAGIQKYAGQKHRQRGSSPKLLVLNTALMAALSNQSFADVQSNRDHWGRLVESAVGAHLVNDGKRKHVEIFYWLNRNREVDFILRLGKSLTTIEVKSTAKSYTLPGIATRHSQFVISNTEKRAGRTARNKQFDLSIVIDI